MAKLPDQTESTEPELDWIMEMVDPNDPTQDPSGSTFKVKLLNIISKTDPAVTATGTTDADAFALTAKVNFITAGAANTGVKLPTAVVGDRIIISNVTTSVKKVYANTSDAIDLLTATTGFIAIPARCTIVLYCQTVALWSSDAHTLLAYRSGSPSDPAIQIGTIATGVKGLYSPSNSLMGVAIAGIANHVFGSGFFSTDEVYSLSGIGAVPGTVSAIEYGDGKDITTVLTLTDVDLGAPTAGGNSAHGALIYTLPICESIHIATSMNIGLTIGGVTTDTPDVGIGSVVASGAVATLDGTPTFEDYVTGQTLSATDGTQDTFQPFIPTAGAFTGIAIKAVSVNRNIYLNAADGWNAGVTGNLLANGTITLRWTRMMF